MIWTFLIIYWVILITMDASMLIFKGYKNHQLIGITFSPAHAKSDEVQSVLKSYQKVTILQFFVLFAASFLLLWEPIKRYADFSMLLFTIIILIFVSIIIKIYQDKLLYIKEKNNWVYQSTQTVVIDLEATREKGKSAVSSIWSWIFVILSFIPTLYLFINPDVQKYYPIIFSLIGPVIQLSMVLMYKQALNKRTPVYSADSELNKALARTQERINSVAATLIGLVMLIFWICFSASVTFLVDFIVSMIAVVVMMLSILAITFWQMKKTRLAEAYFFGNKENKLFDNEIAGEDIYEQNSRWKWGFYYNPDDPRLFVPKRITGMGWTINIARPIGKIFMVVIALIIVFSLGMTAASSMTGYDVQEKNSNITVSSVIYHSTFKTDDIISVDLITEIPRSKRTNGFGGTTKSSGHFSVDGYGPCMFYIYNDVKEYIVLHIQGNGPKYVFVNGDTQEETNRLYNYFKEQAK